MKKQLDGSAAEHDNCDVTDGMRSFWKLPLDVVSMSFPDSITISKNLRVRCSL